MNANITALVIPSLSYIHNKSVLNRTTLTIPHEYELLLNLLSANSESVYIAQYSNRIDCITRYTSDGSLINLSIKDKIRVTFTKVDHHSFTIEFIDSMSNQMLSLVKNIIKYHMNNEQYKFNKYTFVKQLFDNSIQRENISKSPLTVYYRAREIIRARQKDQQLLNISQDVENAYSMWSNYTIDKKRLRTSEVRILKDLLDGIDIDDFDSVLDINNLI